MHACKHIWLKLLHVAREHTSQRAHIAVSMSSDPIKFAYVCLYHKPWGERAGPLYSVNCHVTMLLYRGSFELADLANIVTPLAMGSLVSFPPGTLDRAARVWNGMAARFLITRYCYV